MEKKKSRQLTTDGLIEYNQEVLVPVFENRVNGIDKKLDNISAQLTNTATRRELSSFKKEFYGFKNKSLSNQDEILKKLDTLATESTVESAQDERQKKLLGILVKAAEAGKATPEQLSEIKELNVL
ncbi:MAG: hypothetical protein Q8N42_01190 [bacterium]|nr:hypothetical protein [bacterium]